MKFQMEARTLEADSFLYLYRVCVDDFVAS